jgi:hypothetical protein
MYCQDFFVKYTFLFQIDIANYNDDDKVTKISMIFVEGWSVTNWSNVFSYKFYPNNIELFAQKFYPQLEAHWFNNALHMR